MDMKNDRTKVQSDHPDVSDGGLGDDLRSFLEQPVSEGKPARTRQLRATFRAVPGTDPGFPGSRTFAPCRVDGRSSGAVGKSADAGHDRASKAASGANDPAGRRTAVQQAGADSSALGAALPADKSAGRGRVRGRVGRDAGSSAESSSETSKKPITEPIPIGARVTITDPAHPFVSYAGKVLSGPEKYGLGWYGQRIELDGNMGESYVRPEQASGFEPTPKPKKEKDPVLPAAIKKLVPQDSASGSPSRLVPTETERADARRLFREIGQRFNENRKKSKTAAYAAFRHDLMDNLDNLIMGGALDLKEATTIITNLEQYTKETEAESTETPATILGRWLRMDAVEVGQLEMPAEESGEEIDELDAAADMEHTGDSH